jgi:hypothetical protein
MATGSVRKYRRRECRDCRKKYADVADTPSECRVFHVDRVADGADEASSGDVNAVEIDAGIDDAAAQKRNESCQLSAPTGVCRDHRAGSVGFALVVMLLVACGRVELD